MNQYFRVVKLILFICIVIISLVQRYFPNNIFFKISLAITPLLLIIPLYLKDFKLFVPSLFFVLYSLLDPLMCHLIKKYKIFLPNFDFIVPMLLYLLIVLKNKKFRQEITWLKKGSFDKYSLILTCAGILISAVALTIYGIYIENDFSRFNVNIPDISFALLVVYGLIFPIYNAFLEEFTARAVLFDGFSALFKNIVSVITAQAVIFALWHFQGFPRGLIGIVMVFVWSVFLGIIRHRAKGMMPPLIAHFFADLTIGIIFYFLIIRVN